ncbi:NUDIX hydrolase [Calothrix sp. HK-06]|nr:NUDIX hydrolase [Calothrix sp. HK-06]
MSQKTIKLIKQSGVIPYRIRDEKIEVLLITTSSGLNWIVPKGNISKGMSLQDSAAKEAWEEAGVLGLVDNQELGYYKYYKQGKVYKVKMYLLLVRAVSGNYPEANLRRRRWVDVQKAISLVKETSLKPILENIACRDVINHVSTRI